MFPAGIRENAVLVTTGNQMKEFRRKGVTWTTAELAPTRTCVRASPEGGKRASAKVKCEVAAVAGALPALGVRKPVLLALLVPGPRAAGGPPAHCPFMLSKGTNLSPSAQLEKTSSLLVARCGPGVTAGGTPTLPSRAAPPSCSPSPACSYLGHGRDGRSSRTLDTERGGPGPRDKPRGAYPLPTPRQPVAQAGLCEGDWRARHLRGLNTH